MGACMWGFLAAASQAGLQNWFILVEKCLLILVTYTRGQLSHLSSVYGKNTSSLFCLAAVMCISSLFWKKKIHISVMLKLQHSL